KLGIGERIKMSKGEEASKGRENEAILADTMEAYLGALYLDQGYEAVEHLLLEHLFPLFDEIKTLNLQKDSKSKLQEYVQRKYKRLPVYKIIESSGPDHDRIFTVAVFIEDKERARATGKSKQDAQQEAAGKALEVLGQV
ncbi:MAG TPA: putative dsRNA-binding protein, partial [Patescibacteria group bacterium]|nr:putative dsRNA-binding protein [Patescibacteria group bacterium]